MPDARRLRLLFSRREIATAEPLAIFDASPWYLPGRWGKCNCHHGIQEWSLATPVEKILVCPVVNEILDDQLICSVSLSEIPDCCLQHGTGWVLAIAWAELSLE